VFSDDIAVLLTCEFSGPTLIIPCCLVALREAMKLLQFTITCFGLSPREELLLRSCVKFLRDNEPSKVWWEMTHAISAHLVFVHPRAEGTVKQLQDQGHFLDSLFVTTEGIARALGRQHLPLPHEFNVPAIQPLLDQAVHMLERYGVGDD
jgi:hypothetical protein